MPRYLARLTWAIGVMFTFSCSDIQDELNNQRSNLQSLEESEDTSEKSITLTAAAKKLSAALCGDVRGFKLNFKEKMVANTCLLSVNKKSLLVMQTDGNLVLYNTADSKALWNLGTSVPGSFLQNQLDGNLVMYSKDGSVVWQSGTAGRGAGFLSVRDDQQLVLYLAKDGKYTAEWSGVYGTRAIAPPAAPATPVAAVPAAVAPVVAPPAPKPAPTAASIMTDKFCGKVVGFKLSITDALHPNECIISEAKKALLVMQADGNLVLYKISDSSVLFSTRTFSAGSKVVNQRDGNLVMYNKYGEAIWDTGTAGLGGGPLFVQDDLNLVLYLANREGKYIPAWSSVFGKSPTI